MEDLAQIQRSALQRIRRAKTFDALNKLRAEVLGKQGPLGVALRQLSDLPPDARREAGHALHGIKTKLEEALRARNDVLTEAQRNAQLRGAAVDVTRAGRRTLPGWTHPLRIVEGDIIRSLTRIGFSVVDGPEVEHDWYNFEALNMPQDHPARDMHDTFFVAPRVVLRTHTSNVQIRTMVKRKPPVRIIAPGMVFRHDEVDPTHSPVFHQVEGLWVDAQATFADLKGVLHRFATDLFGPQVALRFRPSFFPFTEPSAEVDITCVVCGAAQPSCRVCKGTGWLEILGAGMVHPAVLQSVGYDPETVQGFAFGAGIERIAMLRWGIGDIRLFYENDLRFLQQFSPAGTSS